MIPTPTLETLLEKLSSLSSPANVEGQRRFGIRGEIQLGVSVIDLRSLARGTHDHELALALWQTRIHEARILASLVDDPAQVTLAQIEEWVTCFDSWDLCDEVTDELLIHTPFILELIPAWAAREEEFVRRSAFASIAALVVHHKDVPDEMVHTYFALIEAAAGDERNYVWKAVNWALRNIGKWRQNLRTEAVACARRVQGQGTRSARWIANDALREFEKKFGTEFVNPIQG